MNCPQETVYMTHKADLKKGMNMNHTFVMSSDKKSDDKIRPMAVAGSFYPAQKQELQDELFQYFKSASTIYVPDSKLAAIIVPHAGYIFSGQVAATAFAQISPNAHYDHIFLLGPAHKAFVDGASINSGFDFYQTPLGKVPVDTKLCQLLINKYSFFNCTPNAHKQEHCIEVQLPFLQSRLKETPPIVPIIIGTESTDTLRDISKALQPYFNEHNLFVISSDFSHYPNYNDAIKADSSTGSAIEKGSPTEFIRALAQNRNANIKNLVTSACGQAGIYILLSMLENNDFNIKHLDYKNSGDSPYGNHNEVVGYHSFAIYRPETKFILSSNDRKTLLSLARQAIEKRLSGNEQAKIDTTTISTVLKEHCGAFVTLRRSNKLRGCIGRFGEKEPLFQVVIEMAVAAAFEDRRFSPLEAAELPETNIEISVLTPLKRIYSPNEFQLGKQGIYILKGNCGGTYLPQVAEETGWTKEQFLEHCAQEKAGLKPNEWRTAQLYTYEAIVFHE
jgi:AmmeMemoRadiSam system protein B/AmmeMemoRadiSam system protein A